TRCAARSVILRPRHPWRFPQHAVRPPRAPIGFAFGRPRPEGWSNLNRRENGTAKNRFVGSFDRLKLSAKARRPLGGEITVLASVCCNNFPEVINKMRNMEYTEVMTPSDEIREGIAPENARATGTASRSPAA